MHRQATGGNMSILRRKRTSTSLYEKVRTYFSEVTATRINQLAADDKPNDFIRNQVTAEMESAFASELQRLEKNDAARAKWIRSLFARWIDLMLHRG